MILLNDTSQLNVGDRFCEIFPVNYKYSPTPDKEYQISNGSGGRIKVIDVYKTYPSNLNVDILFDMILTPITIKIENQTFVAKGMDLLYYLFYQRFPADKYGKNPEIYRCMMEIIEGCPKWFNAQTGFYDYPGTYYIDLTKE